MKAQEILKKLSFFKLNEKSLQKHKERLEYELKSIEDQDQADYFLKLYNKKTRYAENENNLLIVYLLDIVDHWDESKDPKCEYGDFPDADMDFAIKVRDYLKRDWLPKVFGQEYVANIGSFNYFGVKSSIIDMARVYGEDRDEVLAITKNIDDKEIKGLNFDQIVELYPELKAYCEKHPEIADGTKNLINRIRSMGKHAGGVLVSSIPLNGFVPLVRDKEGNPVTAWTEGLHSQDLGPVGLVKIDMLGITNLSQVALAVHLVKQRHNLTSFCALPEQEDWTDLAYLEDKAALAMANRGELKGVFQFDSPGIRKLAQDSGVDCFNDLVNLTSIWRPATLSCLEANTSLGNKSIQDLAYGDEINYLNKEGKVASTKKFLKSKVIKKKILKITLKNGQTIYSSPGHRFLTKKGYKKAKKLKIGQQLAIIDQSYPSKLQTIENNT